MRIQARLEQRPQGDRRGSRRRELHLRLTSLSGERRESNVVVHDLSESGVLLQTSTPLAVGDTLAINLPRVGFCNAAVVWASSDFFGCRFEQPINPAVVSAAQLQSQPTAASRSVSRIALQPAANGEDTFGVRLRRLREQYNLSQTALAKLVGVSKLSIWKWEHDDARPRQRKVTALADLFAVSESELLLGASAPSVPDTPDERATVVAHCRVRIAEHYGVTPDKVSIALTL